ncbi:hypothetical protein A2609_01170 [Candidatus Kaiserbacteria bacterium RIFOXYD1_FULL_47_14]|uniref:Phosphoglycerate mutase n=1 Tax=Candidatus Kaiserbacteria bacterium RIFOXYD1_FULL_47_14 TaxID=1798533 RepID=A0A1F6G6V0_9BACT|nr:MAG: hypothetical protein A2609_01170 [Candidatus Kaiserbacteria bacterium RIFOXYD1_FULL_47_14]
MRIFLIRHASVEYTNNSATNRHIDLSPRGTVQASEMAKLWEPKIGYLYSSTLPRAVQTIEPLAKKLNKSIIEESTLFELDYRGDAALFHEKIKEDRNFKFEGGESITEANVRFEKAVRHIADIHNTCTVAVGTHGTVLSEFLINQFGFPSDYFFKLSYPDVYEIQYTNEKGFIFIRRAINLLPKTIEYKDIPLVY